MIIGECLDSVDLSIGSPQVGILSPILFGCFINDVGDHIRNFRFHLYAVNERRDVNGWLLLSIVICKDFESAA
jgi:hypothetical protein